MKLLLDENLPKKLKYRFSAEYEVLTVTEMGWSGKKNGELLTAMKELNLTILLSSDKNMSHQQNLKKHDIALVVLDAPDNRYPTLLEYLPNLEKQLSKGVKAGLTIINK